MPDIFMPRLSDTMQEGTITRWLKKAGDPVKKGDIVAEVETDKANMEVEAYENGVIEQIVVQEGDTVPIGQTIAIIGSGAKGGASSPQPSKPAASSAQPPQQASAASNKPGPSGAPESAPSPVGAQSAVATIEIHNGQRIKASPLARRIAEEHGINLQQIQGTGPGGRIVRDDLEDYLEQQQATQVSRPAETTPVAESVATAPIPAPQGQLADDEIVTISSMQKTIARRLSESKQTVPHFYISNEVDMTDALALRQVLNNSAGEGGVKVSVNDLIVKACALALEKFPEVNSSFKDGQFVRHKQVNIGVAVDIPNGLVVPVIHDANIKGVRSIAREAKALIEKARINKLTAADLSGSTFSVSNLGMMDVTSFIAVINPPEAAILAIAAVHKTFVPIEDKPVVRDMMSMTMSADHRILYGATVARFLQEVKRLLQDPYSLLG